MSETQSSATLHFLCGKIASGKSTLAQQLVRGQQAVLLSEDTWLAEQAGCSYCCHVLDVSDEECKRRLAARNLSGENPFTTSAEQFDLITAHFSYPSEKEGLVISGR
ncbi:ATP-binding protein [Morganella morganii]|nr:ATP-binding protein [Morganella morganii]